MIKPITTLQSTARIARSKIFKNKNPGFRPISPTLRGSPLSRQSREIPIYSPECRRLYIGRGICRSGGTLSLGPFSLGPLALGPLSLGPLSLGPFPPGPSFLLDPSRRLCIGQGIRRSIPVGPFLSVLSRRLCAVGRRSIPIFYFVL